MDVLRDPDPAGAAARLIAELLSARLANPHTRGEGGRATLALSGGSSPLPMFDALAALPLDWTRIDVLQVDERVAPDRDDARNATALVDRLVRPAGIPEANVHLMPVDDRAPEAAAAAYADHLRRLTATDQPVIDVVHLGLGADGHTASLVPGDPVLEVEWTDIAATEEYQGHRRVTMTAPLLNRASARVWLAPLKGPADPKAAAVADLVAGRPGAPAALIRRERTTLITPP